jgi:hypothetical protein
MLEVLTSVNMQTTVFLEVISGKYGRMDPAFQKNFLPPFSGMGQPRRKTQPMERARANTSQRKQRQTVCRFLETVGTYLTKQAYS